MLPLRRHRPARHRAPARWALCAAIGLLVLTTAGAARLHLESGGTIDTPRWWVEGDTLMYEGPAGTVGIPRAVVLRIEGGATSRPASGAGFNVGRELPTARPAPGPDREEVELRLAAARDHLDRREFELASSTYLELLRDLPELHAARVGYIVSEIAMDRDGMALSAVLEGIRLDPGRADFQDLLGTLRYRDDRFDDALEAWRRAFELAPSDKLRDKIMKVERERLASRDHDYSASSHFNLRYDGEVDTVLASEIIDYLEDQYWVLTDQFRHSPLQPITVQLFATRDFREVTRAPEWVGGLYDGKIRVPLGGLRRLDPGARRVLVHELTHAVIHAKTRGNAPRWLHEGLAQHAEERRLSRAQNQSLRELLNGSSPDRWADLPFSYPLALALVRHLEAQRGFDGLVQLLDRLADGLDEDGALRDVYREDYASLVGRWGRQLRDDGQGRGR